MAPPGDYVNSAVPEAFGLDFGFLLQPLCRTLTCGSCWSEGLSWAGGSEGATEQTSLLQADTRNKVRY